MVKLKCDYCGNKLEVEAFNGGDIIYCPVCYKGKLIPIEEQPVQIEGKMREFDTGATRDNNEGNKLDDGKNRLDLIPPDCTEGIGLVLTFGANKYAPYNWASGIKYSKIIAAIKRHLLAMEKGEDVDKESGLLHADHLACNTAFLQTYMRRKKYEEFDDRFNYGELK